MKNFPVIFGVVFFLSFGKQQVGKYRIRFCMDWLALFPQQRELVEIFNTLLSGRTPYQFAALCVHENPQSIFNVTQNEFL